MSPNRFGYGLHGLQVETCPNCGRETERYGVRPPQGGGINMKRCYYCRPIWSQTIAPLSIAVAMLGIVIILIGWAVGNLLPGIAVFSCGLALQLASHYPKWRSG